jgi:hypothetical protein
MESRKSSSSAGILEGFNAGLISFFNVVFAGDPPGTTRAFSFFLTAFSSSALLKNQS